MKITQAQRDATQLLIYAMGITELEHNEQLFAEGCKFFEKQAPYEPIRSAFLYNKKLWRWWEYQWFRTNGVIAHELADCMNNKQVVCSVFKHQHDITSSIQFPNQIIVEDAFASIVGQFIKTSVNENIKHKSRPDGVHVSNK